ncbi:interleukin-1 receptor-associated kinase 1 isoform X1 [Solea senegalensis]|uniref:Interleukin-1 receptor-associated kinase 1 isoform X1 n=1 Tax=Solea senegalensis TaxID=28829 RepID=A0AAV6SV90_SOLSE|nr:interleukin-1 receptor-associated kinase 1 isoform X1 [Solea senegalensis]KAG7520422.1 interleukin-1 receptor-associated kinase 1 isoform X1 [Solea senegalensis]
MSGTDLRTVFLFSLPSPVHWEFCRVMDGLSDLDWTRFAAEVLGDQTSVRLAERQERRTDWVMNQWGNRNGRVGELIDLLERLQLLRPRDIILSLSSLTSVSSPPTAPFLAPPPAPHQPPTSACPESFKTTPTLSTCTQSTTEDEGGGLLPGPAPPPSNLLSKPHPHPQSVALLKSCDSGGDRVMCWSYEEVHAGTNGFSPSLQVGEGGFGVVYRATIRDTDCAVKRLKQDCVLGWTLLKETFHTEVDKLSKFRHPNIVDLLGVSEGGGSVCLIYSYMEKRSLEEQLHTECGALSWSHRLSIIEGVASALSFLHSPPDRNTSLIHGDVKSSNILLDRHLVAKLADFGLARFACARTSRHTAAQTASVGKTETVRGTLAYLPDEYVRDGELGPAVDVYSFGVVLLEVLTGRQALDRDVKTGDRYLKDLVKEVTGGPSGSCAAAWKKQLDHRLITGGAADPVGWMDVATLACRCLDKRRKKRPSMSEVLKKLKEIHNMVGGTRSSSQPVARPPSLAFDSSMDSLSSRLSKLGPLKDMDLPAVPHPLHSSSSFIGPCETDESRGFSQYDLHSHCRSNGTSSRSVSLSTRDQYQCPQQSSQSSVPVEDQYDPLRPGSGATAGPHTVPESLSPAGSLQSLLSSSSSSVHISPSKQQRLLETTKVLDKDGRIRTGELLPSDDPYGGHRSQDSRGPEESDELDYLPAEHT